MNNTELIETLSEALESLEQARGLLLMAGEENAPLSDIGKSALDMIMHDIFDDIVDDIERLETLLGHTHSEGAA